MLCHHHQSWEHSGEEHRLAGLAHSGFLVLAEPQMRMWRGHHHPNGFQQPGPLKIPMFTSLSSPGPRKSPYFNCFKYFPSNEGYIKCVRKIFLKGKQSQNYSLGPQFRNKIIFIFKFRIVSCSLGFLPSGFSISQLVETPKIIINSKMIQSWKVKLWEEPIFGTLNYFLRTDKNYEPTKYFYPKQTNYRHLGCFLAYLLHFDPIFPFWTNRFGF